jgi:hypothetical protein
LNSQAGPRCRPRTSLQVSSFRSRTSRWAVTQISRGEVRDERRTKADLRSGAQRPAGLDCRTGP